MNNSQQRVLHVLSGMNRGGAETMVMNLYRKMDRSKVQFDFLTYRNDPCAYDEEILSLGGRLFYVPSIGQSNPITFVNNKRKRAVQRGSCAHRFSNRLYRACGKASWSAGQSMPFP
jgi:glycosyltransferase EpsF